MLHFLSSLVICMRRVSDRCSQLYVQKVTPVQGFLASLKLFEVPTGGLTEAVACPSPVPALITVADKTDVSLWAVKIS